MTAQLRVQHPEKGESRHDLTDGFIVVGRAPVCKIQIPDPSVSWKHAGVICDRGTFKIYDRESTAGTWLNGTRVTSAELRDGDEVRFGDIYARFVLPASPQPTETSPRSQSSDKGSGRKKWGLLSATGVLLVAALVGTTGSLLFHRLFYNGEAVKPVVQTSSRESKLPDHATGAEPRKDHETVQTPRTGPKLPAEVATDAELGDDLRGIAFVNIMGQSLGAEWATQFHRPPSRQEYLELLEERHMLDPEEGAKDEREVRINRRLALEFRRGFESGCKAQLELQRELQRPAF